MFEIDEIEIEHSKKDVVTDNTQPVLSFLSAPTRTGVNYEAGNACVLYGKQGACKTTKTNKRSYPYITQKENTVNAIPANILQI